MNSNYFLNFVIFGTYWSMVLTLVKFTSFVSPLRVGMSQLFIWMFRMLRNLKTVNLNITNSKVLPLKHTSIVSLELLNALILVDLSFAISILFQKCIILLTHFNIENIQWLTNIAISSLNIRFCQPDIVRNVSEQLFQSNLVWVIFVRLKSGLVGVDINAKFGFHLLHCFGWCAFLLRTPSW